ncbi:uncharacterized protein LOC105900504 isoform X2 [Clupea harengus]|uniref:Uncharacterized protein LOC105900504 isoform X2 n=1 Tax=Clupea harengus TaxID=7950 RepID=A0A6P3VWK8_CLUHA|nr:uncharacterized protein LOC105900504 isoform X2 [Clupea harengus]
MYTYLHKVLIPKGLKPMLEGFSRAVVRCKPDSVQHFAEKYFKALLTFRVENPNLGFDELLKAFQQSKYPLLNPKASIRRLESKEEWEAGPLLYEASVDHIGPVSRFPAGDSGETTRENAQEFTKAQFLTSESVEAQIEKSDLDGLISANVITLSPGPISPEMAAELAVFRRKTTPKSSPRHSHGSSLTGDCSQPGSQCGRLCSALFERVPLSDIDMDMDAVLIKTSILPNVSQIIVQSEEVPEIIVFQADIKLTDSVPDPECAVMKHTTPPPTSLTYCSPDTGDAVIAKMSESLELIASKCVMETSEDQTTAETKIDSAPQRGRGSASLRSSRSNIAAFISEKDQVTAEMKESASQKSSVSNMAACFISDKDQVTAEMKESASQKSSVSNMAACFISEKDQVTAEMKEPASQKSSVLNMAACFISDKDQVTAEMKESASQKSSVSNMTALSAADENQITKEATAYESSLDSASQKSSLSNIVIPARPSVCDETSAAEIQTVCESKEVATFQENQVPEVAAPDMSVLDIKVSATDMAATTLTEPPAAVDTSTSDGTPETQTPLQSQENVISGLTVPDVLETNTKVPSPCHEFAPALAEGKTSVSFVSSSAGAIKEAKAPVLVDVPSSARVEMELFGPEAVQITQANSVSSLEVRAPYLVYLPLQPVEVLMSGMIPQACAEGEEVKASSYVCIPVATGELSHNPSFVAAMTPQLSRTGSFAGIFNTFPETQKTQNSTEPSRPASQGHMGFSKARRPCTQSPAGVSMTGEGTGLAAHTSASLKQQAAAAVTNNGQLPNITCCSYGKLPSRPSEPVVASACPCVGPAGHWRLCHLTHPGAQSGVQPPCHYQASAYTSQCGLEQKAKIPMYLDCGLYCSCHHMPSARSSGSSMRPHHMPETTCSGHNLGPLISHQCCSSKHVCGQHVLPDTDRRCPHFWQAMSIPLRPHHSSSAMCDHQEGQSCGGANRSACGLTSATTMPSCSHQSAATMPSCSHQSATTMPSCSHQCAATEACHVTDYGANFNL